MKQTILTTQEVAAKFIEMCRQDKFYEVQTQLYADKCVSVEANDFLLPKTVEGLQEILKKSQLFESLVEKVHGRIISDPVIAGDYFTVSWSADMTFKGKDRFTMDEICVYKVQEGKIVFEQFFY
ncbi:nuclear transport factor 2 family protein [Flavobacterium sp. AC]|uniref:Nuclear transport factor 2 family protein n=1 Tax=Flavobacterium azizsancarii TaxID=2961580 RepID=A0ABT4WC47_9FLAO|nr:SnoaL-like domain-containing protein [Flavobacterium azizsancarii]MDA6070085.1 nuclear transport factor 2 family protein [Flavobacterium azizsancarii]